MKSPLLGCLFSVAGFAAALVGAGLVLAVVAGVSFRPGGEFASAWEAATFELFIWGVVLLGCSGSGFAGVTALLIPLRRMLPVPALVGFVAGVSVVAVAGVGVVNQIQRAVGLSGPIATAVPGVVFGCCAVAVAFTAAPAKRRSGTGA